MARKTKEVLIETDNRDRGKTFRITEMSAAQAEKWAFRAISAAAKGGAEVPAEAIGLGMAAVAVIGIQAVIRAAPDEAMPLLDEMMGCVEIVSSAGIARKLIEDDIEEVVTRLFLRSEVLELHTGFSVAATLSSLGQAAKDKTSTSPNAETSPPASAG